MVEHRTGKLWDVPLRTMVSAATADLVLGVWEPVSQAALDFKMRGVWPYANTPFILLSCWLAEWIRHADVHQRRTLVQRYASADLVLTLSKNQIQILVDAGFREDQVAAIPFGCEPSNFVWRPGPRDLDVVAAGFDHGRDYVTLMDGVRNLKATVHVLCQPDNLRGVDIPPNVVVHGVLPYREYCSMLLRAKVVAVATHDLAYPTGQSVGLDALAAGAALAFTQTPALSEYFPDDIAAPVPVADAHTWHQVLTDLLEQDYARQALARAGHRHMMENFTNAHMWSAFREVLTRQGLVP
ncbi:MAG: glycosyltransferase [Kocuria sp.]|nr:glycosyltransferase [Kocuria sp.]